MYLNVKLVTGKHMITDEIQKKIDSFYNEENYNRHFFNSYVDFNMFVSVDDTWNNEMYLVYNHDIPVAIFRPSIDRWNRVISSIKPIVFEKEIGIGTFIFAWCINHYFNQGYHKITTQVYTNNIASLRLNRKFLHEEGCRRQQLLINNKYENVYDFGLLSSDYFQDKNLQDKVMNIINQN